MKRHQLLKHLKKHGCELLREGARHTVYVNRVNGKVSTVPRHSEIVNRLAGKICKDLDIEEVG